MNFLKSNKSIEAATTGIQQAGQAWRTEVHRVGCSIIRKWHLEGDVRVAIPQLNALREALGTATRVNAFNDWVLGTGSVGWSTEDKCFVANDTKVSEHALRGAIDTPFWDYTKPQEYKPMADWMKAMKQFTTRARKDIEEQGDSSVVNIKDLQAIEALLA